MSAPSSDPPSQPPTEGNNEKHEPTEASTTAAPAADAAPTSTGDVEMKQEEEKVDRFDDVPEHVLEMSPEDIRMQIRMIDSECRMMKQEQLRLMHEQNTMIEQITDNTQKIKQNKVLPYLVGNVVEILDMENEGDEEGAVKNEQNAKTGKCAVIKTSSRQVDEKPTDTYADIGGLDKQIEELVEAIVLPMQQADKFKKLGIKPPKGALMYGPPGTGKTLLARACAAQTNACYLKLAGPSLVQMFIGDGAKLVRDAFELAKEKAPAIIFIDELDAIGTKRFDSDKSGDREVQRTMLELLNQLDGFGSDERIKVIAATNRIDILDPALLRSGRLDRKIEFPLPNEEARARIMQIHARKMTVSPKVNFEELARSTDEFNGAQLKAVCVEAGMIALREGAKELNHEHFHGGIMEVAAKKKSDHFYFA
ncbi:26S proteasome regulatory subunit 6A [Naganishia onofrii]|uniref:26S proteasome regulatory subunit 6A n=1 Tax=Naganishia onofrii TaxID=1851511 RepID=A0ACC2XMR6_9TREE|nr:26S proteasome regulatory subunit 6A [Naganishia onofrii]